MKWSLLFLAVLWPIASLGQIDLPGRYGLEKIGSRDFLLLDTVTGETWKLEMRGDGGYRWITLGRGPAEEHRIEAATRMIEHIIEQKKELARLAAEKRKRRIEAEKASLEAEKRKTEQEKQRIEAQKRKPLEEKRHIEAAKRKAEQRWRSQRVRRPS